MNVELLSTLKKVGKSEWYNGYHIHPSLNGYKRRSIKLLVDIDKIVRVKMAKSHKEWQCFILIDANKSDGDAVYIHTPNPYETPFPIKIDIGRLVRNYDKYISIINSFRRHGYVAHKVKGYKSVVAYPKSLTSR